MKGTAAGRSRGCSPAQPRLVFGYPWSFWGSDQPSRRYMTTASRYTSGTCFTSPSFFTHSVMRSGRFGGRFAHCCTNVAGGWGGSSDVVGHCPGVSRIQVHRRSRSARRWSSGMGDSSDGSGAAGDDVRRRKTGAGAFVDGGGSAWVVGFADDDDDASGGVPHTTARSWSSYRVPKKASSGRCLLFFGHATLPVRVDASTFRRRRPGDGRFPTAAR